MTALYAVLGRPVAHSLSPRIHGRWFAEAGIDAVYLALEVPAGRDAGVADAVRTLGLAGANLTAPLKEVVVPAVDALEGDAATARAVNVLARDGGRLVGANTDAAGFVLGLGLVGAPVPGRAVVIGAGGAARAVVVGLARAGTERIAVLARRPDAAARVVDAVAAAFPRVGFAAGPIATAELRGAELVAVAVSGRSDEVAALDPTALADGATWVDLAYGDPSRPGLARAQAAGLRVADGLPMLVGQAALAFERWTGARPDPRLALERLRTRE